MYVCVTKHKKHVTLVRREEMAVKTTVSME